MLGEWLQTRNEKSEWQTSVVLNAGEVRSWWRQKPDQRVKLRTIVNGAVNDCEALVLLDSGANVSILSQQFVSKQKLKNATESNRVLSIQGLSDQRLKADSKFGSRFP